LADAANDDDTDHNITCQQKTKNPDEQPLLLVVEDSPTTQALLSKYFGSHYRLLHASDGVEACDVIAMNPKSRLSSPTSTCPT
jgi:response regulator RpfG family c-di-GMP phosphodiesterase